MTHILIVLGVLAGAVALMLIAPYIVSPFLKG